MEHRLSRRGCATSSDLSRQNSNFSQRCFEENVAGHIGDLLLFGDTFKGHDHDERGRAAESGKPLEGRRAPTAAGIHSVGRKRHPEGFPAVAAGYMKGDQPRFGPPPFSATLQAVSSKTSTGAC
eukprot:5974101-Pyramimonas_sp.AAC.1